MAGERLVNWRVAEDTAGEAVEVPATLISRARRQLLANEPLRARSAAGVSADSALSAGEVEALESVGLSTERWTREGASDPLVQSIADFMALIETSLSASEAAKYLKLDASRIRQRLRERTLYGFDYDGEKRLPRFQFERRKIVPGLNKVLPELPVDLGALDIAEWFLSPNPDLETDDRDTPLSPREWLLSGQPVAAVVNIARGFE